MARASLDEVDVDSQALLGTEAGNDRDEDKKPEGWSPLVWSFAASGVMTVSYPSLIDRTKVSIDSMRSSLPPFFLLSSRSLFSAHILRESGYGHSLPVCHTSAKVLVLS